MPKCKKWAWWAPSLPTPHFADINIKASLSASLQQTLLELVSDWLLALWARDPVKGPIP
jgi:hypothetical protein